MLQPSDLDKIKYLPAIRTRHAELRGYRELKQPTKAELIPLLSLGKYGRINDPERILASAAEQIGGQFFLDLNTIQGQTCEGVEALCSPDDAYAAWRNFASSHPSAIPVAYLQDGSTERPFIQQVRRLERDHNVAVIRSRHPAHDLAALQAAMSAVDDVNNMLIILDFGYIRGAQDVRKAEALRLVTALRTIDPAVRIVLMSSSFPKAVSAYGDVNGTLEIIERDFHWQLGGDDVTIYGDHASIFPLPSEPTMSRWVPRIDYCLPLHWTYRRYRDDNGGFARCAREITSSPDWDEEFCALSWGADIIRQTALAGEALEGFGAPANWIAARVNMHIERQLALATAPADEDDDFDDLFD